MERYEETVTIPIEADISQFNQAMTELEGYALNIEVP